MLAEITKIRKQTYRMKTFFAILTLTLITNHSFGQTEKVIYKAVSDSFEKNYNSDNFESIFSSFSSEMQNALPIDKTKDFLTGLKAQAGKITKREFVKYEQTYASYKTTFERALFTVNISVDNNSKINGLLVKPFKESDLPKIVRNTTKLELPFKGEWTVIWGGDTKELNYHVESEAQKNAFDMVVTDEEGKSYKSNGKSNEDYYAFGKELIAPCDGEIVLVVDGVKDNIVGEMNKFNAGGNTIIMKTSNNEYLVFCHFKHQSIKVKEGQKVQRGQLLGQCGNTGNSSEPHLHFHIQNVEDINMATGVKCYFNKIIVNGQTKTDYSPIQKDKIKNE